MKLVATLLAVLTVRTAAKTVFLSEPTVLWQTAVSPVGEGNECAFSPTSNPTLVCTAIDGSATALQPESATTSDVVWNYMPEAVGTMSSTSGVTFSSTGSWFVYATTDITSTRTVCRVHAVSVTKGTAVWVSGSLGGSCSGTPVVSGDDDYVFLTHNSASSSNFTILDATDGSIFYREAVSSSLLLSPPGIYVNPLGGNYATGAGNTNDLIVFGNRPAADATSVVETSSFYAFQFPIGFPGSTGSSLGVVELFGDCNFESTTPPVITNSGSSMFWGVSRSTIKGWSSVTFDRDPGGNSIGFDRGDPASRPIIAELAIGVDKVTPTLYSGTAGNAFAAVSTTATSTTGSATMAALWQVGTDSPVYTQGKVAPSTADEVVFFFEQFGVGYAVDAVNGTVLWTREIDTTALVLGNFAINAAGDTIYVADNSGVLAAWQVAEFGANKTFAPSAAPVDSAAPVVSGSPVDTNVSAPTDSKAPTSSAPAVPTKPTRTSSPVTSTPTVKATSPVSPQPTTQAPTSAAPAFAGVIAAASSAIVLMMLV